MVMFMLLALGALLGGSLARGQTILFTSTVLPQPYQTPMTSGAKGIYIAAAQYDATSAPGPMGSQAVLLKYDSSGKQLWSRQVPEPRGVFPRVIASDNTAVYVGGSTGFFFDYQAFVRKYDEAGNELWFRKFPVGTIPGNQTVTAGGIAIDDSGVYVSATKTPSPFSLRLAEGLLTKLSPSGSELWSRSLNGSSPGPVTVDATGLYITGLNAEGGFVSRYTLDGEELWRHQLDQSVGPGSDLHIPTAVVSDSTGIYVGGGPGQRLVEDQFEPDGPQGAFLLKLDTAGNEVWTHHIGGSRARIDAIAVDDSGVYGAGTTLSSLPGQCRSGSTDPFVRKYDAAGNEQWTRQFGTPLTEAVGGIALDSTGVYISGGAWGPGGNGGSTVFTKISKNPALVDLGAPYITAECVVNAANNTGGGVAPGEIVTVYGGGMGGGALSTGHVVGGRLTTFLEGTQIFFDGVFAPILYSSTGQSGAIVPYSVSGKQSVRVGVAFQGASATENTIIVPVFPVRPAVFTRNGLGNGQGVILNQDGSSNSPENPAGRGSVITMYMTGVGLSDPALPDGTIVESVLPKPRIPVVVSFEDPADPYGDDFLDAEIISAGGSAGRVAGFVEVKFRVPATARTGSAVPIRVMQNGQVDPVPYGEEATVALR
jgi:uncharacterized protein (TIGR03437 family)